MCAERTEKSHPGELEHLLRHPGLWRARESVGRSRSEAVSTLATGFAELDAVLPGGGWPSSTLIEILHDAHGVGELSLLLPALSCIGSETRLLACIAPPHRLCVPALCAHGIAPASLLVVDVQAATEIVWAAEQALRSGACAAVLLWLPSGASAEASRGLGGDLPRALRRLHLAAESGRSLGVLFRPLRAAAHASPAPLRIALRTRTPGDGEGPCLELIKSRGGRVCQLPLDQLGLTFAST